LRSVLWRRGLFFIFLSFSYWNCFYVCLFVCLFVSTSISPYYYILTYLFCVTVILLLCYFMLCAFVTYSNKLLLLSSGIAYRLALILYSDVAERSFGVVTTGWKEQRVLLVCIKRDELAAVEGIELPLLNNQPPAFYIISPQRGR